MALSPPQSEVHGRRTMRLVVTSPLDICGFIAAAAVTVAHVHNEWSKYHKKNTCRLDRFPFFRWFGTNNTPSADAQPGRYRLDLLKSPQRCTRGPRGAGVFYVCWGITSTYLNLSIEWPATHGNRKIDRCAPTNLTEFEQFRRDHRRS